MDNNEEPIKLSDNTPAAAVIPGSNGVEASKNKRKKRKNKNKKLACSDGRIIPGVSIRKGATGKTLIATEKFTQGSLVFSERAMAWATFPSHRISLCTGCGNTIPSLEPIGCYKCSMAPYCSPTCQTRDCVLHEKHCSYLLGAQKIADRNSVDSTLLISIIKLISMSSLSAEENNTLGFGNITLGERDMGRASWDDFLALEFHQQSDNSPNVGFSEEKKGALENAICELYGPEKSKKYLEYAQRLSENSCAMEDMEGLGGMDALGVFPRVALMKHSCSPTCYLSRQGDTISVRTLKDFSPGDEFTISLIDLYQSTEARRRQLFERRFFHCDCKRCVAGDGNSLLKAILCPKCNKDYVFPYISKSSHQDFTETIPTAVLKKTNGKWQCASCGHTQTEEEEKHISNVIEKAEVTVREVSSDFYRRIYGLAYDKLCDLFFECRVLHPYHEVFFNMYSIGMNYWRCCKDYRKAIKWCNVIINIMENSGTFPALYPEVSNFYYCLGELYQLYTSKRNAVAKSKKGNVFSKELREAFQRSYDIRKLCYGPTHPTTLAALKQLK